MNKFYSEFALVTRIKFPFFPRPNLIFYKPYVTSRNGPLMHNTTAYTSHIQHRNNWVIVEYHNELWDNSKSSYTLIWATEKKKSKNFCPSLYRILSLFTTWMLALFYFYTRSIRAGGRQSLSPQSTLMTLCSSDAAFRTKNNTVMSTSWCQVGAVTLAFYRSFSSKLWLDTRAESSHLFLFFLITS